MNLFVDPPEEILANPEYKDLVTFAETSWTPTSEIVIIFLEPLPNVVNDMLKFDNLFISDEDTFENRIKYIEQHGLKNIGNDGSSEEFASTIRAVISAFKPLIYHLKRLGLIMYITPFPSNNIDKGRMNPSLLNIITDYVRANAKNQDHLRRLEDEKEKKTRKPKVAKPKQQPQQRPPSALSKMVDSVIYGEGTWKRPREVVELSSSPEILEEPDTEKSGFTEELLTDRPFLRQYEELKTTYKRVPRKFLADTAKVIRDTPEDTEIIVMVDPDVKETTVRDAYREKPKHKVDSSRYMPILIE